ncbi:phosphoribosyl-ATP pyrophosphohydrolase [Azospirillum lipoferum]|uniref:Phosphoribosyl-ATP pyrophosphatase n=1 Tax=Azospirillum lipoferum TaxID=193 RepID=A0A5A9GW58_AZOLI|nr:MULTISPECIES: phosphoribosyl-ATP diphosphatase [Azospirillum]KAA0598666.1 phosphoribosyl-ATP diphosphatase [Azospirillum lipoferum]MCP1609312.1 phosphoribosyl-ATP pyrophosphohydrolase [Azospirillum lipoferum]MDW5535378.1 phosphoribosyl-ATP diphosphatase [Azospirillum sp. NL1]
MIQYIGPDPLRSLYDAVQTMRREPSAVPETSRTGKLLAQGRTRMARKVGEEAIEVAIEAMRGDRGALVMEAADLLYNLVVLLADLDIAPDEILAELRRRELAYGIAEKLPKSDDPINGVAVSPAKPLPAKTNPAKRCKR